MAFAYGELYYHFLKNPKKRRTYPPGKSVFFFDKIFLGLNDGWAQKWDQHHLGPIDGQLLSR